MSRLMDAYKELIAQNPPVVIESDEENDRALEIAAGLMRKDEKLSAAERKLLRTWSALIQDYEKRRYAETFERSNPNEVLKFLMDENGLTQTEFRPHIQQSRVSDILTGKRPISKNQAKIFAERFKVSPALFL